MSNPEVSVSPSTFAELGLDPRMVAALTELDYLEPTPIQRAAIPVVLSGQDMIGQAATGTGKTAAFALPVLHMIAASKVGGSKRASSPDGVGRPMGLVLAPTRELAVQVADAARTYGESLGIRVLAIYGGQPYGEQLRGLARGVDLVVATPGRALDHVRRGSLQLSEVKTIVLDEADEMLDMGFAEDIEAVLSAMPEQRQVLLFSATMPPRIAAMAARHQESPAHVAIAPEKHAKGTVPKVREMSYIVPRGQKVAALQRILEVETPKAAIIFCRTRQDVDELSEALAAKGLKAEPLHGGMSQSQRERVLRRLKDDQATYVIATDVAARGLDIDHLTHVVNFDVPGSPETYVHRIGRVGRAGREGVAITLGLPRDIRLLRMIEATTKRPLNQAKVPTVAQLKEQRLATTKAALEAALGEGGLESFDGVLESLAPSPEMMAALAKAAIKLVHGSLHRSLDHEEEITTPSIPREKAEFSGGFGDRRAPSSGKSRFGGRFGRGGSDRGSDRGSFERGSDRGRFERGSDRGSSPRRGSDWGGAKSGGFDRGGAKSGGFDRGGAKSGGFDRGGPRKGSSDRAGGPARSSFDRGATAHSKRPSRPAAQATEGKR